MTKKLLIVTGIYPPAIGGAATYAALLRRELPKKGIAVTVLTYGKSNDVGVRAVSLAWPKGLRHLLFFVKAYFLACKSDAVLAADSSFGAATVGAAAARLAKKKFILRVTGDYSWEQGVARYGVTQLLDDYAPEAKDRAYPAAVLRLFRWQKWAAERASRIIAPSAYLESVVMRWGIPAEKITVIHNGVDFTTNMEAIDAARLKLGLRGKVVLSAGRFVPWKGFEMLIDAFHLLTDVPDVTLIIVGDGLERKKLESKITLLKLGGKVRMPGVMSRGEFSRYLAAADVFALNTGYEGFSHQIIEAMAAGLPVITTDVGGNPEIITDKENGILVEYNDKEMLASAMRFLLQNDAARQKLGAAARETAKQFTKEKMIEQLAQLLTTL